MWTTGVTMAGAVLVLAVVAAAVMLPDRYQVERSLEMSAPPEKVYATLARLETRKAWSTWYEKEPQADTAFTGTSGEVGATMRWKGKEIGEGQVRVISLVDGASVETELQLIAPVSLTSSDVFTVEPAVVGGQPGARVTWTNRAQVSGMQRLMALFMEGIVGPDYERGLSNLKRLVEQGA